MTYLSEKELRLMVFSSPLTTLFPVNIKSIFFPSVTDEFDPFMDVPFDPSTEFSTDALVSFDDWSVLSHLPPLVSPPEQGRF